MPMVLNEEQRHLRDTAREFLQEKAPVAALRELRDDDDSLGYSQALWAEMAAMGWSGIIIPEEFGGLEFGFAGLGVVLQETGRTLTASPLFATCVLGASAILLAGDQHQKEAVLPGIAAGDICLALALEESHRHEPLGVRLRAERSGNGYRLNGAKQFVLDGHSADRLVVVARSSGEPGSAEGISLLLVDAHAPGISRRRTPMMDSRNAARIEFHDVDVPATALLGGEGEAWPVLEQVLDRGRAAIAAEMLGSAHECFERTVGYLKQRQQFGALIGTFQALQHRAAQMFIDLELLQSVVRDACDKVDSASPLLAMVASLAKARANDACELVSNEAVQMHGGIGITDQLDIGLFLKRARVTMQILGDTRFHRSRYATLRGF
ncbi:MAG: acyl-CoA/acyl-ACP dehydrogenase [Pseudomonadales bacterium]|jgi:alkylation response protein AidB-like acyl-CoA dehydrogenase|nr:acyl-CoA/acyl-ACP dehydrogenase [Pseudomonadales bacterium]MCP5320020.1 acyl-CoA/acyl-ACP dehydrogenase [Pseudomonadales bacterium]MCP5338233.1 acyl-CoA/acyl-ACP dehydrogenase [Pseudomonadales bacterium]